MWRITNTKNPQNWRDTYVNKIFTNFDGNHEQLYTSIEVTSHLNREFYLDNITPTIANQFDKFVRFWNNVDEDSIMTQREPIKLYIDSRGGSLSAALTIIDTIKLSRTPVYTVNIGNVFKEAFYIYLAGLKRYSYPRASFYYEKDLAFFNLGEAQSNYEDFIKEQQTELHDMLMEGTKVTESDYEKRSGWWLTPEKAYNLHICNEVLRSKHIA